MKNKEHYASEIADIACSCHQFAVAKRTGTVTACENLDCSDCIFAGSELACVDAKMIWAEAEYKEPLSAKTVNDKFRKFCIGKECEDCEYSSTSLVTDCRIRFVFENYQVIEKEIKNEE